MDVDLQSTAVNTQMGHQLLLCSSIPHKKYTQTVSTLQALTGQQQPQDIATYTIITKPHNVFKPKVEAGKVNQIEQYYMKCTTTWNDEAANNLDLAVPIVDAQPEIKVNRLFNGERLKQWTFHVSDIPTAGKNTILAQNFYESTMVHHHNQRSIRPTDLAAASNNNDLNDGNDDLIVVDEEIKKVEESTQEKSPDLKDSFLQFLEDLGYDVINQYWLKGIRFFYGDIVIEIFKVFVRNDSKNTSNEDPRIPLKLLDETNTLQIKAYITYPKGTNVDLISEGSKELTSLKATLQNLFALEVPDRLFMDSRVLRTS